MPVLTAGWSALLPVLRAWQAGPVLSRTLPEPTPSLKELRFRLTK